MNTASLQLSIRDLDVVYESRGSAHHALKGVSLDVRAGEMLALVGESGSGKSTLGRAILGLLPESARIRHGSIRVGGTEIVGLPERALRRIRGARVALIPQDPAHSLDPVRTIGAQLVEAVHLHEPRGNTADTRRMLVGLLERVGIKEPERRLHQYPHELSGGMRQRVLIAAAIAQRPALIVADEPTSALDVSVQVQIMALLAELRHELGTAMLFITHDLGLASEQADRVAVLQHGTLCETGETRALFANPRTPYTRRLLADLPLFHEARAPRRADGPHEDAIVVSHLTYAYKGAGGRPGHKAVRDISFNVVAGQTHGIVGESGSGKTTLLRCLLGLITPDGGSVQILGQNPARVEGTAQRALRRAVQFVYQNPHVSFDPRSRAADILAEPLINAGLRDRTARAARVRAMLERVQLPPAVLERRAANMSGGQSQRLAIARALLCDPKILILDEVVSALDVSVQAEILTLLETLQQQLNLTYVFVSHDLAVVRRIADTVSIIHAGEQVEHGPTETVFSTPRDDYTKRLLAAIPGRDLMRPAVLA
ncbi:ABC transporter ATP-binding protein [Komagataeibacter nataicola]|uniref:ABC transporter ATP-binding protein n=1 Tax=Komagataeibacter nataicola TaxID=265960 RepID=A0A9N7CCY9_9PROT|nr:ABC transporter ATP-binding protein [Komagataeibacter nataicola]AQU88777.1 ABC transporter ATP-binding protein [Komagataeibacter nataicola]PYD67315.1 ABC transporter ATP-binding protein [Komagataeibacter nataicola]WEQ56964.1 ABC transporter ATP-binding protein [Komagataeibacter nataicola]WNM08494.1 ABC transporter ATP-binding protein [Komagataeibacter nataicola]GBR16315.1 ABC transporter ATP-binding protein [Komagataeibacter nataicola NRIC 0616]